MKFVAIDFETANRYPQSACAVGICVYEDGIELENYVTLIKPPEEYGEFDYRNIQIHHIRPQDVRSAPSFMEVYRYLAKYFFGAIFVAHNASFDMGVFKACCEAYHLPVPSLNYICTVRLAKKVYPFLTSHRLNVVSEYLGIELDHHEAMSDANACAGIVLSAMVLAQEYDIERLIDLYVLQVKQLG